MKSKTPVSIIRCTEYKAEGLKPSLLKLFTPFGGIEKIVTRNSQVLIKPNLLKPSTPEEAVVTHPLLLKSILEICLDLGSRPFIGDSPGFYSLNRVAQVTGLSEIASKLGVKIMEFRTPVRVKSIHSEKTLRHFKIDRQVLESDCIINVPKLKAHQQLVFTGAVKNLYGCIPGKRKAKYHYQFGDRDNLFAEMLVENYQLVNPTFTIIDAIMAMEGNGPVRGRPRNLGLLIGGKDCIAIDRVLCEILDIPYSKVFTLRAAQNMNAGEQRIEEIEIHGEPIETIRVKDFLAAIPMPIKFQFWRFVRSVLKNLYFRWIKEKRKQKNRIML